jgi:hypothetical protein
MFSLRIGKPFFGSILLITVKANGPRVHKGNDISLPRPLYNMNIDQASPSMRSFIFEFMKAVSSAFAPPPAM